MPALVRPFVRRIADGADVPGSPLLLPRPAGTAADFDAMQQQIQALEVHSNSLQALVCELLHKNQELRAELATLRSPDPIRPNASATRPPPHPGHSTAG